MAPMQSFAPTSTASAANPYEEKFNAIMQAIADAGEAVPQELQQVALSIGRSTIQPTATTLDEAFEHVGEARKKIDQIMLARFQMHSSWRNFLGDAAQKWKEFTENFKLQEMTLSGHINTAKAEYRIQRQHFNKLKATSPATDLEVEPLTDEEGTETIEVKDNKKDPGSLLQETLSSMQKTFESLKTHADTMIVDEEQKSKKRKSGPSTAEGPVAPFC